MKRCEHCEDSFYPCQQCTDAGEASDLLCEFCEEIAVASGLKFAGDHSPATGPFAMCGEHLKFHIECNGLPFGEVEVINEALFDAAVWEQRQLNRNPTIKVTKK